MASMCHSHTGAASAASLFLQLSKRSAPKPLAQPLLDFLVPFRTPPSRSNVTFRSRSGPRLFRSRTPSSQSLTHITLPSFTRSFTTSTPRCATVCVRNPQADEEGKAMQLEVTDRAAKRLSEIMKREGNPHLALRIQVESGGCHGFQYTMSLVTLPTDAEKEIAAPSILGEDDVIFQFSRDGNTPTGTSLQTGAPKIILDTPSLDLLKGSKVDFQQELIGSEFKIVDNPYATSSCGCGTSFDIKM